ncbi:MAG: site-2 protease family protein [Acidimicrobiales bacterium]
MSDQSHWWPGERQGATGAQNSGPASHDPRTRPTSASGPFGGGAYYYPPGTTPGARRPNPVAHQRPRMPLAHWVWIAAAVLIGVVLVLDHRISRDDVVIFCVLVPSIILHEIAHGWVALACGDDTAKRAGRLTLNPIPHVDMIGTVLIPLIMIWAGWGFLGYAKPVPVNVSKLRSPRNQGVLVSLAGPATNVILCVLSAVAFHLFDGLNAVDANGQISLWALILVYVGLVNLWLAVFNMIPIPPLDGSVLVERMLPRAWWPGYLNLRRHSMALLLAVVVLASFIPDGGTTLIGAVHNSTVNWWLSVLGVPS